ncbi:MAG: transporter substrate-binding domain-containing protein, partial [Gammaproteobacteria bacterium]|nr:transporter substrate-binding domain-containing protein [Gammaproteobacteria bacterium]
NKKLLEKHMPKATIKEFTGGGPALAKAVSTDRVMAVINDVSAAYANMAKYGDEFMILDGDLYVWPEAFGVRPEKTHLIAWLNNWIAWAIRDGKMDQWAQYWRLSQDWQKDHQ